MVTNICAALVMSLRQVLHAVQTKQRSMRYGPGQRIRQHLPKRSAEPFVRGYVEADLGAGQDPGGQFVLHQILQNHFLPRAADAQIRRKRGGELDNTMIEKRRTYL